MKLRDILGDFPKGTVAHPDSQDARTMLCMFRRAAS
jgi:hypothetical protein